MSLRTNIESFQTHLLNDLDYHFDICRFNGAKITTSIELALDPKIPGYDFHGVIVIVHVICLERDRVLHHGFQTLRNR